MSAREDAGLTQVDLAVRLGRPQPYAARHGSGERRLDVVKFLEVAGTTGCEPMGIVSAPLAAGTKAQRHPLG